MVAMATVWGEGAVSMLSMQKTGPLRSLSRVKMAVRDLTGHRTHSTQAIELYYICGVFGALFTQWQEMKPAFLLRNRSIDESSYAKMRLPFIHSQLSFRRISAETQTDKLPLLSAAFTRTPVAMVTVGSDKAKEVADSFARCCLFPNRQEMKSKYSNCAKFQNNDKMFTY